MSWNQHVAAAERARESRGAADKALAALAPEWRPDFIRDAFFQLSVQQQRKLVAEMLMRVPADEAPTETKSDAEKPKNEAKPPPAETRAAPPTPSPKPTGGSYVDKAEAYVLAHPEGVTTPEVAKAIGQKTMNADGTLRQVMNVRKTIEHRDRKWFPKASDSYSTEPVKKTIRSTIFAVFAAAKKPLDSMDIWEGAKKLAPDINRGSFENEMNRLRRDKLIVAVEGRHGKHGSGVYVVANGGTHAAP